MPERRLAFARAWCPQVDLGLYVGRRRHSSVGRPNAPARDALVRELVSDLAPHAGTSTIRLAGHGGSGKTIALVLLATQYDARVIVLTFHHALRGDIRHVFESMPEAQGLLGDKIHVETATSFLLALVAAAGGTVALTADGSVSLNLEEAHR